MTPPANNKVRDRPSCESLESVSAATRPPRGGRSLSGVGATGSFIRFRLKSAGPFQGLLLILLFQVAPKGALRRNRARVRIIKLLLRGSIFWTRKTLLKRVGSLAFRELSWHYQLRLILLRLNCPLNCFRQARLDGPEVLAVMMHRFLERFPQRLDEPHWQAHNK